MGQFCRDIIGCKNQSINSRDCTHPEDQTMLLHVTLGFKPFTLWLFIIAFYLKRNEMILLYDLKQAAGNCEFEIQSLK